MFKNQFLHQDSFLITYLTSSALAQAPLSSSQSEDGGKVDRKTAECRCLFEAITSFLDKSTAVLMDPHWGGWKGTTLSPQAPPYWYCHAFPWLRCPHEKIMTTFYRAHTCSSIELKMMVPMSVSATAYELSEGRNHIYPLYFHYLSGECTYRVLNKHLSN